MANFKVGKYLLTFALILVAYLSYGQGYKTGIGLRAGTFSGVSVKHSISNVNSIEGMLTTTWGGAMLSGVFQWNNPINHEDIKEGNLNWYYGIGGSFGNHDYDFDNRPDREYDLIFGPTGMLGLEYTFEDLPLNFSLDWQPVFDIVEEPHFLMSNAAFTFRFVFK